MLDRICTAAIIILGVIAIGSFIMFEITYNCGCNIP